MVWKIVAGILLAATVVRAQTDQRMVLEPWPDHLWGETFDHMLYQEQGHVKDGSGTAQMFWWDSIGRFRFSKSDDTAPAIAYRYVTVNFDTNSPALPDHLDKFSLAGAVHVGQAWGGNLAVIAGGGYSSDSPFADANGIFGIGHLIWYRTTADQNLFALTLDYDGGGAFLPDVPLPGFQLVRHWPTGRIGFGFPRSFLEWNATDRLTLNFDYAVPYTAEMFADYKLAGGFSLFGNVANFFEAYELRDQPATDRFFQQMSRAELGVRYQNPDIFKGMALDAALSIGYAFDQDFYRGFDVRGLDRTAAISDEPYIALILRGTF
jgi:hypothetical protein